MVIPLTESRSPLARLVLFMFCLSVAGTFIAGVHYAAIDLPQQNSLTAPENGKSALTLCFEACEAKYWRGTPQGVLACAKCYEACFG